MKDLKKFINESILEGKNTFECSNGLVVNLPIEGYGNEGWGGRQGRVGADFYDITRLEEKEEKPGTALPMMHMIYCYSNSRSDKEYLLFRTNLDAFTKFVMGKYKTMDYTSPFDNKNHIFRLDKDAASNIVVKKPTKQVK